MEHITENNNKIRINPSDFKTACKLKSVIMKALKESDIRISDIDIAKLYSKDKEEISNAVQSGALDSLIKLVMSLDGNEEVEDAVFDCLLRCTYNSSKITREIFDESHKAREDYYLIKTLCIKENLTPFFKGLSLTLNLFKGKDKKGKEETK